MSTIIKDNKKLLFGLAAIIFILSAFIRFYHLNLPGDQIFDEVYFPVFANDYLTHTYFYDAHPPLGKLIIAMSIAVFGNNPFGWRFANAVAGLLLLAAVYGFTYSLTKRWQTALLALFIIAIEPMALVESRVGLINIYLALFSITGLWAFWVWHKNHKTLPFILAMLSFGAAASVKWIGLGALGAAALFWFADTWQTRTKPNIPKWQLLLFLLVPIVYFLTFIPDLQQTTSKSLDHLEWWHKSSWSYHAHLDATHPYGANWWKWPTVIRPIWLYYKSPAPGTVTGTIELGNVVTWISGLVALGFAMVNYRNSEHKKRNLFLVLTYLSLYVPWIFIGRVKFIYHYFVPVLILLILLSIIIDEQFIQKRERTWIAVVLLTLATVFFIYFLPLLMGLPISQEYYQQHMWFKSWI